MENLDKLNDEKLMMEYVRNRNLPAFDILLSRYRQPLYSFLLRLCRNRELAQDLYQETFLRVVQAVRKYKPRALFRTWLYTIARNLVIDAHRKKKVRTKTAGVNQPGSNPPNEHREAVSKNRTNPHQAVFADEIRSAILAVLHELPDEQREMFLLREEAGLDFKQAAIAASCTVNTAKSRMRYALIKLRDELSRRGICPEETINQ